MAWVFGAWEQPWELGRHLVHDCDFESQDVPTLGPAAMGTLYLFSYPPKGPDRESENFFMIKSIQFHSRDVGWTFIVLAVYDIAG